MDQQVSSFIIKDSVCPVCGGTGFEISYEERPGYPEKIAFARPCSRCAGTIRSADNTGIPLQYAEAELQSFDFSVYGRDMSDFKKVVFNFYDNFYKWRENGMGIYFYSKTPGSGKTLLACSLGRSLSLKYDVQLRFITAVDYLSIVGASYHRESGEADASEVFRDCEILILDDVGAAKNGQWQSQEMFRLINGRLTSKKITIYTSNFSQNALNLDARLVDRIISSSLPLALPEISIRRKRAEKEQNEIIRRILEGE